MITRPYRNFLRDKITNETVDYVEDKAIEQGWMRFVVVSSLEDEDNAPTTIGFGVKDGDIFHPMEEEGSPSAGLVYTTNRLHVFYPLEKPTWRIEGGTSGDNLSGIVEGYEEKIE